METAKRNRVVMAMVRTFIRDNPDASKAFHAMRQRGTSERYAEEEIARALSLLLS